MCFRERRNQVAERNNRRFDVTKIAVGMRGAKQLTIEDVTSVRCCMATCYISVTSNRVLCKLSSLSGKMSTAIFRRLIRTSAVRSARVECPSSQPHVKEDHDDEVTMVRLSLMFVKFCRQIRVTFIPLAVLSLPTKVVSFSGGYKIYKLLTFLVGFPIIGLLATYCYVEHTNHPPERQPFIKYPHLRFRTKKFPWGDGNHSLFHNPHLNALPEGYEELDEEE